MDIPAPVSTSYSLPHTSQFRIVERQECCSARTFQAVDLAGNFLFESNASSVWNWSQIVQDDHGRPIVYVKQKRWSLRRTWEVYRGQKPHGPQDFLFSIKAPSAFQWKTSYSIFLSGKETPDFTLSANFREKHYKIHHNDVIIAEADFKFKIFKPSEMVVTANAGVDRMFITAILVILRIKAEQSSGGGAGGGAGGAGGGA